MRELTFACRQRVPETLRQIDNMLVDPNLMPSDRIRLIEMVWNRGYGKPRQTVYIADDSTGPNQGSSRVRVYLPDNNRTNTPTKIIDAESK